MRIVLDTNVLARATPRQRRPGGLAREILLRTIAPTHTLIVSPFLLTELDRALRYPQLKALHGLSDLEIDEFVTEIEACAYVVQLSPATAAVVVGNDPDDDPIVATAVEGGAELLCTRDKHLLGDPSVIAYCASYGVRLVDDVEMIRMLRQP
jgi:putative PIN family toxin of toxin-antitoxin system